MRSSYKQPEKYWPIKLGFSTSSLSYSFVQDDSDDLLVDHGRSKNIMRYDWIKSSPSIKVTKNLAFCHTKLSTFFVKVWLWQFLAPPVLRFGQSACGDFERAVHDWFISTKTNKKFRGGGQLLGQLGSGPCFLVENQVRKVLLKKKIINWTCLQYVSWLIFGAGPVYGDGGGHGAP